MERIEIIEDIDSLRNKAVNYALVSFTLLGAITVLLVSLYSFKFGFTKPLDLITQVVAVILLTISSLFRKYLTIDFKIGLLAIVLLLLCLVNFYGFGILSAMKIFIVVFPIFLSFVLSLKKALMALAFFILVYALYGFLFLEGKLHYHFDINIWAMQKSVWITSIAVLLVGSVGLLLVGHFFNETLKKNFVLLKTQNSELIRHRENLENIVQERTEELKTALEHIKETQMQLMQSEKMASLGILTAGVAHEINNPLNFIMGGYCGLESYFLESGDQKDEKIQFYMNSIITGIQRVSDIVNGLNQFSRNGDNQREDCNIHSIINNCLVMLNNQLIGRIEINKNFIAEEVSISGNVGKLHQVFVNILSNSISAIKEKGSISITTYKLKKSVVVEITDSGIGISKENLVKIAVPFFTTKDPGNGIGLGLSIAYSIIKDHKGVIEFQSELNKGTKVKVTLPELQD